MYERVLEQIMDLVEILLFEVVLLMQQYDSHDE